ncbi:hypothetical protein Tco_0462123, partial [Tanacetum coccineum]
VSSVNVVDIDEFCLHDLKDMVVKLGYGVEDLMYCHFLIPSLGLDYGLHSLNVDAEDVKWEKVSSKSSSIGEVMKKLSKEQPASYVARPVVVESAVDYFDGLDEILGYYANTRKQITKDESTWKQMLVHVGTSFTADDLSFRKFKEVEVEGDTESEEKEGDPEGNDTSGSDLEDLDYDPKHDDAFDDDEHIVEEVHVNMNNFSFTTDPKHDTSIGVVDVQEDDLDVINYDSFGSDLDDGIDYEKRIQLRELRRIGKQKKQGFLVDHVIKSLATNPNIPVRAVQDQMQKQFKVGVSKMKAFKAKRIASNIMTGSYREQYSLLREYAQELMNQNSSTTVKIDVQQEPNPESLTRIFRRVYVCLGALNQGFRACG